MHTLNVGLFGLGTVGSGVYEYLESHPDFPARIAKIAVANPEKIRSVNVRHDLTDDEDTLLNDPEIDTIIEVINDANDSFRIVKKAIENGKHVISANKKMIALYQQELELLNQQYPEKAIFYEAAVCGSIPILGLIDTFYQNNLIRSINSISNGTCNFILSNLFADVSKTFSDVLKQAQALGYAEEDPSSDIDGYDSVYKLCILIKKSFGIIVKPDQIPMVGIRNINETVIALARQLNCKIKLIGHASFDEGKLTAYVMPMLISENEQLYTVENEDNAVEVESYYSNSQLLKGAGAGKYPTASAIIADLRKIVRSIPVSTESSDIKNVKLNEDQFIPALIKTGEDKLELISLFGQDQLTAYQGDIVLAFSDQAYERYCLQEKVS